MNRVLNYIAKREYQRALDEGIEISYNEIYEREKQRIEKEIRLEQATPFINVFTGQKIDKPLDIDIDDLNDYEV